MTQYAIVKKVLGATKAEVEVLRGTACGDSCGSCEVCKYSSKIRVEVQNHIGAETGDRVEIESATSKILGAAVLVYVIPFVLFFLGYAIAHTLGYGEGGRIAASFALFAVGMLFAVVYARTRKKPITFNVVRVIGHGEEE